MALDQNDVVAHYRANRDAADGLLTAWHAVRDELEESIAQTRAAADAARNELAAAWLPELTPEALAAAEKLTGYRGFSRRDPLKAMAHEAEVLRKTIRRVEADPRYQRRQVLVGPGGELRLAVDEAKEMLAPWEAECARFEELEGWDELLLTNYDTPEFTLSFFQARYWVVWRNGDAACEALGLDDFGDDVLPAFHEADRNRATWRRTLAEAEAAVEAVHELVRARDRCEALLPRLPDKTLEACRTQLAGYFAGADLSLLEEWLVADAAPDEPDRGLLSGLRTVAGLTAKVGLLEELRDEGVASTIGQLIERRAKFDRKFWKYTRAKYQYTRFEPSALDRGFPKKLARYRARPDKVRRIARQIVAYDAYDRYELARNADALWFLEMTGKTPSSQLPSTRRWYERHPDATLQRDPIEPELDPGVLAVAAVAASRADDLGYLS